MGKSIRRKSYLVAGNFAKLSASAQRGLFVTEHTSDLPQAHEKANRYLAVCKNAG
jgi:hypothetical protein